MSDETIATQEVQLAQVTTNAPPEAVSVCVATAEGSPIGVPVLAAARDPDGDPLEILDVSEPASGRVEITADGTLTFVPEQPGLQSFSYLIADGQGGTDTAEVVAFVNPIDGELAEPVLQALDEQALARVALACAHGQALDVVTLTGEAVTVPLPEPGQRVEVAGEPGQRIVLQSNEFIRATFLVAEGGLLVLTDDGRMVYVADFVAAAESGQPPILSVAGGPAVSSETLLANLQPMVEPTEGEVVGRLPSPETGPEHWGGAAFTPYDPGSIAAGPFPTGPLLPTALGLGTPPVLESAFVTIGQAAEEPGEPPPPEPQPPEPQPPEPENAAPVIEGLRDLEIEVGEITVTPNLASARAFPSLTEQRAVDPAVINGADQRNLTLGPAADAKITFVNEIAAFQNTLGVYLIGPDNTIQDPKIVFIRIEHADADPRFPFARPGGGPLSPGDSVLLSDLYDPADLQEGTQIGFFFIADGWRLNRQLLEGDLEFRTDGDPAKITDDSPTLVSIVEGREFEIRGNIYHTANVTDDGLRNQLNDGGNEQVISGLGSGSGGLILSFEDKLLLTDVSDDDVNDTIIKVDLTPTTELAFPVPPLIAPNVVLSDADSDQLSRLRIEIVDKAHPDDALEVTAPLRGLTLVEDGNEGLIVIEGDAPIETYQEILRSIVLLPGRQPGARLLELQVSDEQGEASRVARLQVDFSDRNAEIGTNRDDPLIGDVGDDAMSGRGGDDSLFGFDGDDLIDGGTGDDELDGGPGNDRLFGGPGEDDLTGGEGADVFAVISLVDRGDRVLDFNADEGDVLDFSALFADRADELNIDPFVRFENLGDDVRVDVDLDGPASDFSFIPLLTLIDPVAITTAQDAVDNNTMVV